MWEGPCGVDSVESDAMPGAPPSWEQSKAFVWDGSLSVAIMLSAFRESLYSLMEVIRKSLCQRRPPMGYRL